MTYRRCGRSGVLLPAISLGLWQNFGAYRDELFISTKAGYDMWPGP